MITCGNCKSQNSQGSQYCDECGATLSVSTDSFVVGATPITSAAPGVTATSSAANKKTKANGNAGGGGDGSSRRHTDLNHVDIFEGESPQPPPQGRRGAATAAAPPADETSKWERAGTMPHAKLVIQRGRSAGKGFLLNDAESHIGRWDADGGIFPDIDLDTDDPEAKVSRRHARIIKRADGYFIEDLGSTNGTFVNRGRRLLPGYLQQLGDGDEIIVGKTFLRLYLIN